MAQRNIDILRSVSLIAFGAFLILLLGANSVAAAGGPLTWLTIWNLPTARGDLSGVGLVILLPVVSVVAWALYRWLTPADRRQPLSLGTIRITLPASVLWLWAIGRGAWQCVDGPCPRGTILRLIILAALFFWVYLLIANEKPDLLWVIVPVVVVQSAVAIAQFVIQHDLGLRLLGELPLDPAVSGISVVMNGDVRWLRGYGLTIHPNTLARLLVLSLMMLPVLVRGTSRTRRLLVLVLFVFGTAALATTLARWAWLCFFVGLGINAIPSFAKLYRDRSFGRPSLNAIIIAGAGLVVALFFMSQYGGTVFGRFFDLDNPPERQSIYERSRDIGVSVEVIRAEPLGGVGPSNYEAFATAIRPDAILVHSVPLLIWAELGLVGLGLWLWLFVWPLWIRGPWGDHAPTSAIWITTFLLGLFYFNPYPLADVASGLLFAIVAGLMAIDWGRPSRNGPVNDNREGQRINSAF